MSLRAPVRRYSRTRAAVFRAIEAVAARSGGRVFYVRHHLRGNSLRVREVCLRHGDLPSAFEGFTIVHLSDVHAGPFVGKGDLDGVVALVNSIRGDLCVISGDFITHRWSDALTVLDECARLRATAGVFAVFGNHDYRDRLEGRIATAYLDRGIRFLRNERIRISRASATLSLVGLEDIEEARDLDLDRARGTLSPGEFELILCHNPAAARCWRANAAWASFRGIHMEPRSIFRSCARWGRRIRDCESRSARRHLW